MDIWQKLSEILQNPGVRFEVAQTARYRMGEAKQNIPLHQTYVAFLTVQGDVFHSPRAYGETMEAATVAVIKLYEAKYGGG